ncbi:MAG: hypothetical protein IT371_15915 [Deltaproteobacteria bacterium]|nr:hypothetical protein [Deltaproteobacteria bacterium]
MAHDPRRQRCDTIAELLEGGEAFQLVRLLQGTKTLASPPEPSASQGAPSEPSESEASEEADEPTPIGIWEPQTDEQGGLRFERAYQPHINMDEDWSHRQTLHPRTNPLPIRVCYFGESAAAAAFYLPDFTLGKLIEEQLRILRGPGLFEVIDLSRVSQTLSSCLDIAVQALQLKPDIMVFFAGNNWPRKTYADADLRASQDHAEIIRGEGIAGLARAMYRETADATEMGISYLSQVAAAGNAKGIFVIPETNLIDFHIPQPVWWMAGDGVRRWHALFEQGSAALGRGEHEKALSLAEQLFELDEGQCASSLRLGGLAYRALGRTEEAAAALRAEAAACGWDATFDFATRVTPEQQELFRSHAAFEDWGVVDLPRIFAEHTGTPLSDRRMFLDYCHMSHEGLRVTAAAIAAEILRVAGSTRPGEVEWQKVFERAPAPPSAEVQARALFHAASHNVDCMNVVARRGALAEEFIAEAVSISPGILDTVQDYATARLSRCEPVLSTGARRVLDSAYVLSTKPYLLREIAAPTMNAAMRVLERHGRPVEPILTALLRAPRGRRRGGIDLVDGYYRDDLVRLHPRAMFGTMLRVPAVWPTSSFFLPATGDRGLTLEATLRLPANLAGEGARPVRFFVNGREVGSSRTSSRWQKVRLEVAPGVLRRGTNEVMLRWPEPPAVTEGAMGELVNRMELGYPTCLHPVLGEVASLVARGA